MTKSQLVLALHLIGFVSGAIFLNQSKSVVKQNQTEQFRVTFDSQSKAAL